MRRTLLVTMALFLMVSTVGPLHAAEREVVDSAGRSVILPDDVQSVIVFNPPAAEIMRAIGVIGHVSGSTRSMVNSATFWPELQGVSIVANSAHGEPDYEAILTLMPDLVITYGTHPAVDVDLLAEVLGKADIPVLGVDAYKLATLYDDIELLGRVFSSEERAGELISFLSGIPELIEERLAANPYTRVRVYAESHAGEYRGFGGASEWTAMIEVAGGTNILAEYPRSTVEIDAEIVLTADPDVILKDVRSVPPMGFGVTDRDGVQRFIEDLSSRTTWDNLQAVTDGRVYVISSDLGAGLGKVIAKLYLATLFHPDLFADVCPNEFLREYIEGYQGLELEGVFIYPEINNCGNR